MILIHLHCIDSSVDCSYNSDPSAPPTNQDHNEGNETNRYVTPVTSPTGRGRTEANQTSQTKASQSNNYLIPIVTSLAVALLLLALVIILYMLYRRHGKMSSVSHVRLHEINNDDHHGNTINDEPTVQPAQEAGGSGDQLQVFSGQELTTPTESSQPQCSQPTLQELINKKYVRCIPLAVAECSKQSSSLVGFQNYNINLSDTVA